MSAKPTIRVGLVEDNDDVRESLTALLRLSEGFTLAAACADAEEAIRDLPAARPDVVLVDINLPGRSGISCVRELRRQLPQTGLLMLTIERSGQRLTESLEAGADGYLVKTTPPLRILEAIQEVNEGGSPISSHVARLLVQRFRQQGPSQRVEENLTEREERILRLLAHGHRAKEVAGELGVSVHTIRAQVRTIYAKLHARSLAEAVAKFIQPGEE
jgi:DNA-binding NarL/FixJ family response regulator